jgi:hypothetical protein
MPNPLGAAVLAQVQSAHDDRLDQTQSQRVRVMALATLVRGG